MKCSFAIALSLFSQIALAQKANCHLRFNNNLALYLTFNDHAMISEGGVVNWDDYNECEIDEELGDYICTQVEGGEFEWKPTKVTPVGEEAVKFKLKLAAEDNFGNRLSQNPKLMRFVKRASFEAGFYENSGNRYTIIKLGRKLIDMSCTYEAK